MWYDQTYKLIYSCIYDRLYPVTPVTDASNINLQDVKELVLFNVLAVSGDGRVCPPGQEWKQCVRGAVLCTDLMMGLSRNCTPGCQCPAGTVWQVGAVSLQKYTVFPQRNKH